MQKIIKNRLRKSLDCLGINAIARKIYQNNPRILVYHEINSPDIEVSNTFTSNDFRKHLEHIKIHYNPMTLSDLVKFQKNHGYYPKNALVITFDDGFQSFHDFAWPLLCEFEIPATIFVCPDLVENESWIWPDRFRYIYDNGFNDITDKTKEEHLLELKKMSTAKREEHLLDYGKKSSVLIPKKIPNNSKLMSWNVLKSISESNLIEIGSHTLTHPIMSKEDTEFIRHEIYTSRSILQNKLNKKIESFCYPNGCIGDYTLEQIEIVIQAGYRCAVATHFGYVTKRSNIMALPRVGADYICIHAFKKHIDGFESFIRKMNSTHCDLCLQKNFEYRITKEFCKKNNCSNTFTY